LNKVAAISTIKKQLQDALPEAIFEHTKRIKYRNAKNEICEIEVELYDHISQVVVMIDENKRDVLVADLLNSGYIPIEYTFDEINARIKDECRSNKLTGQNQYSDNGTMSLAITGGYNDITVVEEEIVSIDDVKPEHIDVSSYGMNREEIQDLIGKTPGWLLRSGIALVFFVSLALLFFASIIKYPDKISSTGVLTSTNPPIALRSKISGRVEEVFVENGAQLQKGEPILFMRSTVKREDVERLKVFVSQYQKSTLTNLRLLEMPRDLSLGPMQASYGQLFLKFSQYKQVLKNTITYSQIQNIERETNMTNKLNETLTKEADLYDVEKTLIEKDHQRQKQLYADGVISEKELEQSAAILSQYDRQKEAMQKTTIQNDIRKEALGLEKNKIIEQRNNTLQQYRFAIAELIESLQMGIVEWEDENYVTAESDGSVEISTSISKNVYITPDVIFGYVLPATNVDHKYIRALVLSERKGKIEKGSKAIIKFDAFPYKEYGVIVSEVESLSLLSTAIDREQNRYYELIVPVESLITEYGEQIEYSPEMSVIIEIITEDRTILGRIMERFYDLIQNR